MKENNNFFIGADILTCAFSKIQNQKKKEIAILVLEEGMSNNGYISQQSLIEFVKKIKNKDNSTELLEIIKDLKSVYKIVQLSMLNIGEAVELSQQNHITIEEAIIVQTMKETNVSLIYTEDIKQINRVLGIQAKNPYVDKKIIKLCTKKHKLLDNPPKSPPLK